jgi:hypothetical protein
MPGWLTAVWWKVIKDYSTTELSYEKDIFPALSGIAQEQMEVRGSRYLAGLWEDTFVEDLLWYIPYHFELPGVETHVKRGKRPSCWRAPSWSWGSVKSAVEYDMYLGLDPAIEIKKIDVGGESTGQIQHASLTVSGGVVPVSVHRPDDAAPRAPRGVLKYRDERIPAPFFDDYDLWLESEDKILEAELLKCLLIGRVCGNQRGDKECDQLWFMILRKLDREGGHAAHVRIGVAVLEIEDGEAPEFVKRLVHTEGIVVV